MIKRFDYPPTFEPFKQGCWEFLQQKGGKIVIITTIIIINNNIFKLSHQQNKQKTSTNIDFQFLLPDISSENLSVLSRLKKVSKAQKVSEFKILQI